MHIYNEIFLCYHICERPTQYFESCSHCPYFSCFRWAMGFLDLELQTSLKVGFVVLIYPQHWPEGINESSFHENHVFCIKWYHIIGINFVWWRRTACVVGFALICGICLWSLEWTVLTCRASDFPREYDGACLQMRMSYSPAAHFFLFLVQWTDCHLAGALGLLRILIYKVKKDS